MLRDALIAALLLVAPVAAQSVQVDPEAIDALFAEWDRSDSPGCSLGVIHQGELVYSRGYGLASLEHGIANRPDSVFRIASTSKQVTAACLGLLAIDGKLSMDDEVRAHLPELPDYGAPLTLRHLVHHTSGLRDYLTLMSLAGRGDGYSTEEALAAIYRQGATNFTPGTEHLYSNTGHLLMAEVVHRVSGLTLREFAEERFFAPLGMRHTRFLDDHTEVVPRLATGYSKSRSGAFHVDMTQLDMVGDGGLHTTVEDWLLWDRNAYEHTVGGEALHALLRERAVLESGEELEYAYGLGLSRFRGLPLESHGGAFVGYRAESLRFPEQRFSVVCFSNLASFEPGARCREVAELCLAEFLTESAPAEAGARRASREAPARVTQALTDEERSSWVGSFQSFELLDVIYRIEDDDERLWMSRQGGAPGDRLELSPVAPRTLEGAGLVLRLQPDGGFLLDAGRVRGVHFEREASAPAPAQRSSESER